MAAKCKKFYFLFIAFGSVMRLAEHLAVGDVCRTTFGPSSHMISVHLNELIDTCAVGIFTHRAKRTVGDIIRLRLCGLLRVLGFLHRVLEETNLQQFGQLAAAKDILKDTFARLNVWISIEFLLNTRHLITIVRCVVVFFV